MVMMSVDGASPQHPMQLFRMKAAAEDNLRSSTLDWTIIRAGPFLQLHLELMRRTAGKSGRPLVFGRGQNPITFVSVTDVAEAVVNALLDPSQRHRTITVAGTSSLTLNDLAAITQQELGTSEKTERHVPRPVLHVLAATRVVSNSAPARQAQAALIMDTADA